LKKYENHKKITDKPKNTIHGILKILHKTDTENIIIFFHNSSLTSSVFKPVLNYFKAEFLCTFVPFVRGEITKEEEAGSQFLRIFVPFVLHNMSLASLTIA